MRKQINNLKILKSKRRALRKRLTPAEAALWTLLKSKQFHGKKFRRQHSVGFYILDFYCAEEKLAIELDGEGHFTEEGMKRDEIRTAYLNGLGIRVLRFENEQVFTRQEAVMDEIKRGLRNVKCERKI